MLDNRLDQTLDRANSDVVLIVDDVPDNLSVLHDALDESGCTVLVATSGEAALQRARQAVPDIVLLDAMMPGMDGFEVVRQLKAMPQIAHIPIIFMIGLLETEHLVAALQAGGVDYVTKPIKPKEVMARMDVHLQGARRARQEARQAGQARNALDAFGYASMTVRINAGGKEDGKLVWQTPLARELMLRYYGTTALRHYGTTAPQTPAPVLDWLRGHLLDAERRIEPPRLVMEQGPRRLTLRLHQQTEGSDNGNDWLIVMREISNDAVVEAIALSFKLTARESEVLYWVVKGKVNRDIGDILGASPATVKKHLERVCAKLGVETRTAAAGRAMNRIRSLKTDAIAALFRPPVIMAGSVTHQRFSSKSFIYIRLLSQMRRFPEPEFPAIWHCFHRFFSLDARSTVSFSGEHFHQRCPLYGSTCPAFKSLAASTEYTLACSQAGYSP